MSHVVFRPIAAQSGFLSDFSLVINRQNPDRLSESFSLMFTSRQSCCAESRDPTGPTQRRAHAWRRAPAGHHTGWADASADVKLSSRRCEAERAAGGGGRSVQRRDRRPIGKFDVKLVEVIHELACDKERV